MSEEVRRPPPAPRPVAAPALPETRMINSEELFGSDHEVIIRHENMTYRLRITRAGKLILTK